MDALTAGADIGAMLTGLSVLTATIVWTRNQWEQIQQRRAETRLRNWHGYIMTNGIDTWYARLAEEPESPTARVVLEITGRDGTPDDMLAYNVRQVVLRDGMLSRSPTPAELDFLMALQKERGYGTGFPVR